MSGDLGGGYIQWTEMDHDTNDEWTVLDHFEESGQLHIIHCAMYGGAEWETDPMPPNWCLVAVYTGGPDGRSDDQEPT